MRSAIVNYYTFEELTPAAQQKAIEKNRFINVDNDYWQESDVDYFKDDLRKNGFYNIEIIFSGFGCQGDGASFTAGIDILAFFEKNPDLFPDVKHKNIILKLFAEYFNFKIVRNSWRYCHEYTISLEVEERKCCFVGGGDKIAKIYKDVFEALQEYIRDYCRRIYDSLEMTYHADTSDDSVMEALIENEYEFLEDGTPA